MKDNLKQVLKNIKRCKEFFDTYFQIDNDSLEEENNDDDDEKPKAKGKKKKKKS